MNSDNILAAGVVTFALLALGIAGVLAARHADYSAFLTAGAGAIGILVKSPLKDAAK